MKTQVRRTSTENIVFFSRRVSSIYKSYIVEDAATREVFEEAGVLGRLGRLLGVFEARIALL